MLTIKQKKISFEKISSSTKVMSKPIQVQFVHTEPHVWFIKIRTTSVFVTLWIFLDNIIVWAPDILHLKVLAWEICNMKWGFAKEVIVKSQRQFMYGSNLSESDVTFAERSCGEINCWRGDDFENFFIYLICHCLSKKLVLMALEKSVSTHNQVKEFLEPQFMF